MLVFIGKVRKYDRRKVNWKPFVLSPEPDEGAKHVAADFVTHFCFVRKFGSLPFDGLRANGSFRDSRNPIFSGSIARWI
jgi:hypothetical protein